MARTKKHLMERESKTLHQKHLSTPPERFHQKLASTEDCGINRQQLEASGTRVKSLSSLTFFSFEGSSSKNSTILSRPQVCPSSGLRAVVLLEDVCKNTDVNIANMVKKQPVKSGSTSSISKSTCKSEISREQRDGVVSRKSTFRSNDTEESDRTVSSTTVGSKNIFEQLMAGRKSPRKRSSSPRCHESISVDCDGSDVQSSSEEKRQQHSIATAVKSLRRIADKTKKDPDGGDSSKSRVTRRDKGSATNSRNASPSSASPRSHNSLSPKRQSPRRLTEKKSPLSAAVAQVSPKAKISPSSIAESDTNDSLSSRRRSRSPRRITDSLASALSSPRSLSCQDQDVSSTKDSSRKVDKVSPKGEKVCVKGEKSAADSSGGEHTIHILSSTSRGSKVIQVDPEPSSRIVRKLFVDVESNSHSSSGKQLKHCSSGSSSSDKSANNKWNCGSATAAASVSNSANSGLRKSLSCNSEENESLLCAMLVGGKEVTKNYEQNRGPAMVCSSRVQSDTQSESFDWKGAESTNFFNSNDSFFDDDCANDFLEEKPYELPVVGHLPPPNKVNLAVLDLTKTEKSSSETQSNTFMAHDHKNRTESLLSLISRIQKSLPEGEVCETVASALSPEDSRLSNCEVTVESTNKDNDVQRQACDNDISGNNVAQSDHSVENAADTEIVDNFTVSRSEQFGVASADRKEPSSTVGEDCAGPMEAEAPSSPCSLGELDITQMTQAATRAVQTPAEQSPTVQKEWEDRVMDKSGPSQEPCQSSTSSHPSTSGVVWQSSSGGAGMALHPEDSVGKAGPSGKGSGVSSQSRSFFSRISSPSKQRWKPKVEPVPDSGRPGWSRWHSIVSPLPIDVLSRHEKSSDSEQNAFVSKDLDTYLHQSSNRKVIPASQSSKLAKILQAEGHFRKTHHLVRQFSGEAVVDKDDECEDTGVKSEEDEDEDDKESEMARRLDPDFDEVGGLVFVSFPSEMALKAHLSLENTRQWEGDHTAYLNMAKFHAFEESRRIEGKIRRESQGLRGQHMKWRRYQRLYRRELRRLYDDNNKDVPWPLSKIPEKTSDIHKIKNWKKKLNDMKTEDIEALELLGEDEERVKRKRKTYVFSSKKKKGKRADCTPEMPRVKQECSVEKDDLDSSVDGLEEDENYGVPIPIDQDSYMDEVENSIQELRMKEKGLRQSKGIFSRFNMGPEERHIFKKLGGWNSRFRRFRRMPVEMKEGDGPTRPPRKRRSKAGRGKRTFELKYLNVGLALGALSALCADASADGWKKAPKDNGSYFSSARCSGDGNFVDLTAAESSPDLTNKKLDCDKPGCRYGCICHLCLPAAESDEIDPPVTAAQVRHNCDKEYCRLGCICESLEKSGSAISLSSNSSTPLGTPSASSAPPCGKPGCAEKCVCHPDGKDKDQLDGGELHQLTSIKQDTPPTHSENKRDGGDQAESSSDELPTLEKTAPRRQRSIDRYSNLPRRQTSYRIAKNLDAVSRKAIMMWTTSEVYSEQRRKKTPETASPSVTTSPAHTLQSSVMTTSSLSPSSLISPSSSHQSTKVAAAVSVNTLPAMMTSCSAPANMPTLLTPGTPSKTNTLSNGPTLQAVDTSPVVVSDDDDKTYPPEVITEPSAPPKRSRVKKRAGNKEESSEVSSKKAKTSAAPTPLLPVTETSVPSVSSPSGGQWHSSLICLKANNPVPSISDSNDDVLEEDEIKLFEFIVNCQWERSKKEILMAITNTLKRGMYPEPRVMHIGDFRVEILPKASRPSAIPTELRGRLPKAMYSVRVRVTEHPKAEPSTAVSKTETVTTSSSISSSTLSIQSVPPTSAQDIPPTSVQDVSSTSVQGVSSTSVQGVSSTSVQGVPSSSVESQDSTAISTTTPSSSGSSSADCASVGTVGISGLGHLQILKSKTSTKSAGNSPGHLMQHFKIQKEESGTNNSESGEKKKKKKKKKKQKEPADDSLVPDLSNLTVSPRTPQSTSTSNANQPLATSTPAFRLPGHSSSSALRTPVASPVNTPIIAQSFPIQPVNRLAIRPPGIGTTVRPQVLGLPSLPANLTGVKFLQLPGQNNLLQIVPASALGLKPMDNKKVPNFVAVPVSFSSIAPAGLANKKSGSRVQIDVPSKVFTQAQQDLAHMSANTSSLPKKSIAPRTDGKNESEPVTTDNNAGSDGAVKPKKKKRKKKTAESDKSSEKSVTSVSSNPLLSNTMLVASSPSPVMSLVSSHLVCTVTNTAGGNNSFKNTTCALSASVTTTAGYPLPIVASPVTDSTKMVTSELTAILMRPGLNARDDSASRLVTDRNAVLPGGKNTHVQHCDGQSSLPGSPLVTSGCSQGVVSSVKTTSGQSSVQSLAGVSQERLSPSGADDDSRASLQDSMELSSSSEVDDGTNAPTKQAVPKPRRSASFRREMEGRRREELNTRFTELKNVLNVAKNLPKSLSQYKILTKTVSLIQYHQKVPKTLAQLQKRNASLKEQLQTLVGKKMAEGMTLAAIQEVLTQAALEDNTVDISDTPTAGSTGGEIGAAPLPESPLPSHTVGQSAASQKGKKKNKVKKEKSKTSPDAPGLVRQGEKVAKSPHGEVSRAEVPQPSSPALSNKGSVHPDEKQTVKMKATSQSGLEDVQGRGTAALCDGRGAESEPGAVSIVDSLYNPASDLQDSSVELPEYCEGLSPDDEVPACKTGGVVTGFEERAKNKSSGQRVSDGQALVLKAGGENGIPTAGSNMVGVIKDDGGLISSIGETCRVLNSFGDEAVAKHTGSAEREEEADNGMDLVITAVTSLQDRHLPFNRDDSVIDKGGKGPSAML